MSFHDIKLPNFLRFYVNHSICFDNSCFRTKSGQEVRLSYMDHPIRKYSIKACKMNLSDFNKLRDFFYARQGRKYAFLFTDPLDNYISRQKIMIEQNGYQALLCKQYSDHLQSFNRTIFYPNISSLKIFDNDHELPKESFYFDSGIIYFNDKVNKEYLEVECYFDTAVRFDQDELHFSPNVENTILVPNLEMVEVMNYARD